MKPLSFSMLAAALIPGLALAGDGPASPADMAAKAYDATRVEIRWRNRAERDEKVGFDLDRSVNGGYAGTTRLNVLSGTDAQWVGNHSSWVESLTPETDYCFRVWALYYDGNGKRSDTPTEWACAHTLPHPPLAPLDVRAHRPPTLDAASPAVVEWSTPDQSDHRRVTAYAIERQSPPGQNRPWIAEGSVAGPDGEQGAATQLTFRFKSSAVAAKGEHAFRVCAQNSAGRTCGKPVAIATTDIRYQSQAPDKAYFEKPDLRRAAEAQVKYGPTASGTAGKGEAGKPAASPSGSVASAPAMTSAAKAAAVKPSAPSFEGPPSSFRR